MNKGQVSLDLMLSILSAIIFAVLFALILNQFSASQQIISVQTQQKAIGESIAQIISTSSALKPAAGGTGTVSYTIPKINGNDGTEIPCTITLTDSDKIVLTSGIDSKTIQTSVDYVKSQTGVTVNVPSTTNCNSSFEINVS